MREREREREREIPIFAFLILTLFCSLNYLDKFIVHFFSFSFLVKREININ